MSPDQYPDEWMCKWIKKTARREHWRISWYALDDLVQDGYLCVAKCKNHYQGAIQQQCYNQGGMNKPAPTGSRDVPGAEGQRKWFMALVQRTFMNHIYTLARRYPVGVEFPAEEPWKAARVEPAEETSSLFTMLVNAPKELRDLVDRIIKDGLDGGAYLRRNWYHDKSGRWRRLRRGFIGESDKEYWMRTLGNQELVEEFTDYLLPDQTPPRKSESFKRLAAQSRLYQKWVQSTQEQRRAQFQQLAAASRRYEQQRRTCSERI